MKNIIKSVLCVFLISIYACNQKKSNTKTTSDFKIDTSKIGNAAKNISIRTDGDTATMDDTPVTLEKIAFPTFDLKINDFEVNYGTNGMDASNPIKQKLDFDKDKHLTITAKTDTIELLSSDTRWLDNRLIQIIPLEKNDRFKISYYYSYQYAIGVDAAYITDTTTYKPVKDSAGFFFRLPFFSQLKPIDEIKKKLKVTDSVNNTFNGEFGEEKETAYSINGKTLHMSDIDIHIKIERYTNNSLKETKQLFFYNAYLD